MSSVSIRQLRKSFGNVRAVQDFTLDIPDGAFVTLLGPSGCGKTTTLNMLAGLETPDGGQVLVGDVDVTDHAPHQRGMAMVFQSYALYPHKNVFGNLAFSLQMAKVPRAQIEERVRRVARMLEIEELLDRRVGALSGGQQQRVSLARALIKEPLVFLFDEPLSNLDAALRVRTRNEIKRLHQRLKTTSVFVTHDQEEAMVLSDLIAVMEKGAIDQVGSPDDVYHRPASVRVAQFVGKPRINLMDAQLARDGETVTLVADQVRIVGSRADLRLDGQETDRVIIGLRAEDIAVETSGEAPGSMAARVVLVEPLGPDTFVELEIGSHTLTARVDPRLRPSVDDLLRVRMAVDRVHLFDATTERRING
jgi:multiple sugar transport system ATP-binding protein